MGWLKRIYKRVRGLWHAEAIRQEIAEELQFHLDLRTEENIRRGLSPEEARREAERRFGNTGIIKDMSWDVRGGGWIAAFWQDLRYGARMLRKHKGFTFAAVTTLALGVGANTAIFSVVYGVLLRPLPYKDAGQLMMANISPPDFRDLKESTRIFDELALWGINQYNAAVANGESRQTLGAVVSPDFLPMLSTPMLGRAFRPEEDRERLAVISYDLWQSRFQGAPDVLGRVIRLNGEPHTIIGVMPPEFQFPSQETKLWVPLGSALAHAPQQGENRQLRIFRVVAHLKPSVSPAQMQAELDMLSQRLQQQYPKTNTGVRLEFTPLYERIVGDVRPALLVLLGTVGFVLLIACANVANLALARMTAREREIAIRLALGARRWRVARQLLTESLLLASIGGGCGLLLAKWGVDLLPSLNPQDIPRVGTININYTVLLFTLGVSVLSAIFFGAFPAWQATRSDINLALKDGGRGTLGSPKGRRLRGVLVVTELALSLVVLIGAGLLLNSFNRLLRVDPGFTAENLLTLNVGYIKFKDPQQRAIIAREVIERVKALPGVQAVGGGTGLPPITPQRGTRFAVQELSSEATDAGSAYFLTITPDYFKALHTPLYEGRPFTERDGADAPKVVIINRALARRLFPNESAVGKHFQLINPEQTEDWREVVGVVGDVRYSGLDDPGEAAIYTPFAQTPGLWNYLMVRTDVPPQSLVPAIRQAVAAVDPELEAANPQTMEQLISQSIAQPRFYTLLLTAFAVLALLLAAVGIYGVISYSVNQRAHEIGVRMALGAQRGDVLRLIIGQGLVLSLIGIALGLAAATALTRVLANLLYAVRATDLPTFITTALLLLLVALSASYVPARRATKVDPLVALRYE
jgi:putative ABC transport system permease protein